MTTDNIVTLDKDELLTFVRRCFEWRNADVFAFGRKGSISRLGEIAGYICMLADSEGNPRADSVKVVLPPPGGRDPDFMLEELREGVRQAYRRFEKDDDRTAPFVAASFDRLDIVHSPDFTAGALANLLTVAKWREAVIVGEASLYQAADVADAPPGPKLSEDVWCAHLHRIMLIAEEKARATDSYIILDIGEYLPAREANLELLKSAGDVGLCGGSYEQEITPEEMIARVSTAYDAAAAGDIGRSLAAVEGDDQLSERQKWMLRLAMLDRAGLRMQVSETLDASESVIAELKGDALLGVARIAAATDRDDLAQALVERTLPSLLSASDLENALRIAAASRRHALIAKTRDRLRQLHPGSQLLRSADARSAAREGDYRKAADLLEASPDPDERVLAAVFRLLADAISGPGFADPVALARQLAGLNPDRAATSQLEILLSLERAGRRDEAVSALFSGDIVWNEQWFVFARGLLERSLASGSAAVSQDVTSKFIDIAASHIAQHPGDGYARTSVVDLLDADHVGVRGVGLLLFKALQRSQHLPAIRTDHDPHQEKLADLDKLPGIVKHVLEWLAQQGEGVIVSGRHAMPAEVLGENPDAVLDGLLRLVDRYAPDANDPVDEQVLKQFVTVASAVAPHASDPDGDLTILRGAAIKLIIGGKVQVARDLAEQALIVAGDRPGRRRKALAAFADIYARNGRTREALLALIAASELPSSGTWREVWQEQSLLLRLVRDVGMPDQSISLINRLRAILAPLSQVAAYRSRLDTLELHAQMLKHQMGHNDGWSPEHLLDAAAANADAVLGNGDEALPSAVLLRQLIDSAEAASREIPVVAREALGRLTERLAPAHRAYIAAIARLPAVADVAAFAGPIQAARYNDDNSYDLRQARLMGRRLARSSTETADPEGFLYAVELLSAQGLGVRGAGPEVKAAERLLGDRAAPLGAALNIARYGLPVVGLALDDLGLMAITVTADGAAQPKVVPTTTFDSARLVEWSTAFPYRYCDEKLSAVDFRAATESLGLTDLPDKAVLVSSDLARMPANVLTVDGGLVGSTRAIATAPSLAWLQASMAAGRKGDGSAAAWIPIAAGSWYMDTLNLLAGDVEDVLKGAGVPLHTQAGTPAALASADLAIIGAHGGLAEGNRYFRSLSDDQHEPADLRQVLDALRNTRLAILFVCSGGRLDPHPESGGLVGIAHRLLDQGLDAVIAPSWPVPFNVARPWLKAFLEAWTAGEPLIDAYRVSNTALAKATSYDLPRSLAMTLHGNPFITM